MKTFTSFVFVALLLLSITLAVTFVKPNNPYGFYFIDKDDIPTTDGSGWHTKLTYGSSSPLHDTSAIYGILDVNVYSLGNNRDCRIRIVPDKSKLQPGQDFPYVLQQEVAYFSDPTVSTYQSPTKTNGLPPYNSQNVEWKVTTNSKTNPQGNVATNIDITSTSKTVQGSPVANLLSINGLRYEKQWVEFEFEIAATQNIFGFEYHNTQFCLTCNRPEAMNFSLWNTDEPGVPYHRPLYSTHPVVYLFDDVNDAWYSLHFVNSHAQRMKISAVSNNKRTLTFTFLGGVIDCFVIQRDSPLDAISAWTLLLQPSFDKAEMDQNCPFKSYLHNVDGETGNSAKKLTPEPTNVPPYWSLGVSVCRWGYKTIHDTWDAVIGMKNASLELSVSWNDIDWMRGFRMFDNDPIRYPTDQIKIFMQNLSKMGDQKYVQIIDPGVATDRSYGSFQRLMENPKQFISAPGNASEPAINFVWPGFTAFVAFDGDEGVKYWEKEMKLYLDKFDEGPIYFWTDMNEPATFAHQGNCPNCIGDNTSNWIFPENVTWANLDWVQLTIWLSEYCVTSNSSLNTIPGGRNAQDQTGDDFLTNGFNLSTRTLDMASKSASGYFYSTKNMFGYLESRATFLGLKNLYPAQRIFLLSRSSFPGSGRYTSVWSGDTVATYLGNGGLYDQVQALLSSNIVGIPQSGSDTGGFSNPTSGGLMIRWSQLSAFSSFFRYHHGNRDPPQEPFRYNDSVQRPIREAMIQRSILTPFLFSLLVQSSRSGQPTVSHPSFNFPSEMTSLLSNDPRIKIRNGVAAPRPYFMWGDSILIAPVVEEDVDTIPIRFPTASWYELNTLRFYTKGPSNVDEYPVTPIFEKPTPAFLRAGRALPIQCAVRDFMLHDLESLDKNDPTAVQKFYYDYDTIVKRGTNKTIVKVRESNPVGLLVVFDDINNQKSPNPDASTEATGFGYFDDMKEGPIENSNTFSRLSYTSTINATGGNGMVYSVLKSAPPAVLSSTRRFDTRFMAPSSVNTTSKLVSGGYVDIVFSTSDLQNSSSLPLPKYCDINKTGSASLFKSMYSCQLNEVESSVFVDQNAGRVSYKFRFMLQTSIAASSSSSSSSMVSVLDFTQPLIVRWSTQPLNDDSGNSPNNNGNNNNKKEGGDRYGLIITGVAVGLSILLVGAIVGVVYYRNKAKRSANDSDPHRHISYMSLDDVK